MSISAESLEQFLDRINSVSERTSPEMLLFSPEMKRSIDVLVSRRPHQRRLRKVVYRRIYLHRKQAARRGT